MLVRVAADCSICSSLALGSIRLSSFLICPRASRRKPGLLRCPLHCEAGRLGVLLKLLACSSWSRLSFGCACVLVAGHCKAAMQGFICKVSTWKQVVIHSPLRVQSTIVCSRMLPLNVSAFAQGLGQAPKLHDHRRFVALCFFATRAKRLHSFQIHW